MLIKSQKPPKNLTENTSESVINGYAKEIYISPEETQEIIDELTLK